MTHRHALLVVAAALAAAPPACQRSAPAEPAARAPDPRPDPRANPQANPHANPHGGTPHPWIPAQANAAGDGGGAARLDRGAESAQLAWNDPPGWERVPPASPMRRAQYRIPRAEGEAADAELTVITFGAGQGGDIDANLARWHGQVTQPDGRPTSAVATRQTITVGDLRVTITEAAGRIGGGAAMMPGMPAAPLIERGRLLAAIVETPAGPWFFKMTGPDRTVAGARPAFEALLRSLRMR